MSIYNNVKSLPKSEMLEIFIKLKYGEPNHSDEYFGKLPDSVIHSAYNKTHDATRPIRLSGTNVEKQVLAIMLRQPANKQKTEKALHEALVEYHTLLG